MLWSFSRDGGVCMYRVWASVNPRTRTPVNAVWAMTALAFLLGLPMLWSSTAFEVIGSMSAAGLFISCERLRRAPVPCVRSACSQPAMNPAAKEREALPVQCDLALHAAVVLFKPAASACRAHADTVPICLRLALAGNFEPGPFRLHPWARPAINGIAVLYMTLIMVSPAVMPRGAVQWCACPHACMPACMHAHNKQHRAGRRRRHAQVLCIIPGSFPVSIRNLNWTVVLIGFVLALCLLAWYFPRWGARRWYRGKAHTLPNANVVGCLFRSPSMLCLWLFPQADEEQPQTGAPVCMCVPTAPFPPVLWLLPC